MGSTRYASDREMVLDELLIRSIEKLDSIIALRNELNRYMETGMIDLARARYATGGPRSSISSLSFNLAHMEASKHVSLESVSPSLASSRGVGLTLPSDLPTQKRGGDHGERRLLEGSEVVLSNGVTTRFRLESTPARSAGDTKRTPPPTSSPAVTVPEVKSLRNEADADNDEGNTQLRHRQVTSFRSSDADSTKERDSLECSDPGAPERPSSLESTASEGGGGVVIDSGGAVKVSGDGSRQEVASASSISGYSSDDRVSTNSSSVTTATSSSSSSSSSSLVSDSRTRPTSGSMTSYDACHTGDNNGPPLGDNKGTNGCSDRGTTTGGAEQRQRTPTTTTTTTVNGNENSNKNHIINNPLRWFGVLVPSSLRNSKQCFDRALEILTEVASQQNELAYLLDTFQRLQGLDDNSENVAPKKELLTTL